MCTSFPGSSCQCRRPRKIPWRGEWQLTPVFLPGEFHGGRSLAGYRPCGHQESETTEQLTLSLSQDCVRLHPFTRSKQRGGGLRRYLFTEKCVRRFLKGKGRLGPSLPWVVKRTNEGWKARTALPSPTATRPEQWLRSLPPLPSKPFSRLAIFASLVAHRSGRKRGLQSERIPGARGCRGYPGGRRSSWGGSRGAL